MDISTATPSITLTNNSTQITPGNLQWVFKIYSPSGVPIHEGVFTSPDRVNWTTPFVQNSGFPKPYNSIEWGNYKVIVSVKDSNGTIFENDPVLIPVCRPNGNNSSSKNTYGAAKIFITTKCRDARLFAENRTDYSYPNSSNKTEVATKLTVFFPPNEEESVPQTFEVSQFSLASIPITQNGSGYQYLVTSVVDYTLGNSVTLRVKYIAKDSFSVYCNLDLSPVLCELNKLHADIENGTCKDAAKAKEIISLVHGKLLMASISMMFPQSNETDPFKLIDEINKITGWNCDCCTSGVVPLSSLGSVADITFEFVSDGGDITGDIEEISGGIRIHVGDITYTFSMCPDNTSAAFTITPSISGRTKNYCLKVNQTTLANEILDVIKNNTVLLNILNQMITVSSGSYTVNVDGKCVIPNEVTCNYTFVSNALNVGEKLFIKEVALANGQKKSVNAYYDQTNEAQISAVLNGLSIGVFGITLVATKMTIQSDTNPNALDSISYDYIAADNSVLAANQKMVLTKICSAGSITQLNPVLQAIIDYVCFFTLSKVKTGKAYTVKFLEAIGGGITDVQIDAQKDASYLWDQLLLSYNALIPIVRNIKQPDCNTIKALFTQNQSISNTALFYGIDNNNCYSYNAKTFALKVIELMKADADVQTAMCAAIQGCGTPVCDAVTNATASYNAGTGTLSVVITNTGATKYSLYYFDANSVDKTPSIAQEVDAVAGLTTTAQWLTLPAGKYGVAIVAKCSNGKQSLEYTAYTAGCVKPASLSVIDNGNYWSITWGAIPVGAEKVRLQINYPNGGSFAQNYDPSPSTITIDKPIGIYGQFNFFAKTVCNVASNFMSDPTDTIAMNEIAPAPCPPMTNLEITELLYNSGSFKGTKPVGGATPLAYTLIIIPAGGGAIEYTQNTGGSDVTWTGIALTPNTVYSWGIKTRCSSGDGDIVNGGTFVTPPNSANNSSIFNDTGTNATSASIMINGSLVYVTVPLNDGDTKNFTSPNYSLAQVKVKLCGVNAGDVILVSNAITYPMFQDADDPQIWTAQNVNIIGGYQITAS